MSRNPEPRLFTVRDLIRTVADRWDAGHPGMREGSRDLDVSRKLRTLDLETATEEDVEIVVGNKTWTNLWCDCCSAVRLKATVRFDVRLYREDSAASVCMDCCTRGMNLFFQTNPVDQLKGES